MTEKFKTDVPMPNIARALFVTSRSEHMLVIDTRDDEVKLDVEEARELRDYLNSVLPDEPAEGR